MSPTGSSIRGWQWPDHILGVAFALPAVFVLAVVPLLDMIAGEGRDEFVKGNFTHIQQVLLAAAPLGFVVGNSLVIVIVAGEITHLTVFECVLAVLSVGMIGSIGITAAHELVHKPGALQKSFGRLGLLNFCYLHFEINHIEGHHVRAGTEYDQNTAWYGESLYGYLLRTVPGSLLSAWHLERKRLQRRAIRSLSLQNRMLQFLLLQACYLTALVLLAGGAGLLLFLAQALIAVFLLETVSYIEHYGLMREQLPNGRYASMTPAHSWDSYHRFSNYLEFQLQRHADHHTTPARSQELLHLSPEAPRLPAGYPVMISLAMVPPLWRRVMHPRLRIGGGS